MQLPRIPATIEFVSCLNLTMPQHARHIADVGMLLQPLTKEQSRLRHMRPPDKIRLDTHKVGRRHYSLSVLRCPDSVRVGDKVQVVYQGVATRNGVAYKWVDVDEALYVTQITRTYNANGSTSATVQVSNVDDLPIDDTTVLYDQASQVGAIACAAG